MGDIVMKHSIGMPSNVCSHLKPHVAGLMSGSTFRCRQKPGYPIESGTPTGPEAAPASPDGMARAGPPFQVVGTKAQDRHNCQASVTTDNPTASDLRKDRLGLRGGPSFVLLFLDLGLSAHLALAGARRTPRKWFSQL
jgi:hypothetical protein